MSGVTRGGQPLVKTANVFKRSNKTGINDNVFAQKESKVTVARATSTGSPAGMSGVTRGGQPLVKTANVFKRSNKTGINGNVFAQKESRLSQ
jgi:hypothetical protein